MLNNSTMPGIETNMAWLLLHGLHSRMLLHNQTLVLQEVFGYVPPCRQTWYWDLEGCFVFAQAGAERKQPLQVKYRHLGQRYNATASSLPDALLLCF